MYLAAAADRGLRYSSLCAVLSGEFYPGSRTFSAFSALVLRPNIIHCRGRASPRIDAILQRSDCVSPGISSIRVFEIVS